MAINQSGVLNIQKHRVLKRGLILSYWLDFPWLIRYQLLLFPVDRDTHEFFCRLQSNVFDAPSLFQTNHVVHFNVPREDIFFCVASWLFRDVHSHQVYLHEESLQGVLRLQKTLEFVLIIFYFQLINSGHANSSMVDKNYGKLSSRR